MSGRSPSEPAGPAAGVAAVVVNYNAGTHLASCLASLRRAGVGERIVVDNSSTDGSEDLARAADPQLRWVDSGANLGYGRAANLGAAESDLPYLLICNPDVTLDGSAVDILVGRLDADGALGFVGPRILNPDGSVYPSARTFPDLVDALGHGALGLVAPRNRFTARYRMLDWDHERAARVDWVSGACVLARRAAWDDIGGFDPAYFMYLEDVDLWWRARRSGWAVGYEPAASVTHVQGVSADRHPYRMLAAHHRSLWRFARERSKGWRRLALPVVAAGLVGRLGVAAGQHRFAGGTARQAIRSAGRRRIP
ncbi:MAG: glycosyltransferase family 2 protein [Acidimicrobiales bacterium]